MALAERKSRIFLIKKVESKEASVVKEAITGMLSDYKDACITLTFDNGREFSEHGVTGATPGAETYFAHPYVSHERGLNGNFNGLLRQFILKATDLRTVSAEEPALSGGVKQSPGKMPGIPSTVGSI